MLHIGVGRLVVGGVAACQEPLREGAGMKSVSRQMSGADEHEATLPQGTQHFVLEDETGRQTLDVTYEGENRIGFTSPYVRKADGCRMSYSGKGVNVYPG